MPESATLGEDMVNADTPTAGGGGGRVRPRGAGMETASSGLHTMVCIP